MCSTLPFTTYPELSSWSSWTSPPLCSQCGSFHPELYISKISASTNTEWFKRGKFLYEQHLDPELIWQVKEQHKSACLIIFICSFWLTQAHTRGVEHQNEDKTELHPREKQQREVFSWITLRLMEDSASEGDQWIPGWVWYRKSSCLALMSQAPLCTADLQGRKCLRDPGPCKWKQTFIWQGWKLTLQRNSGTFLQAPTTPFTSTLKHWFMMPH